MIKKICNNIEEIISYIFFGICTTAINIILFYVLAEKIYLNYIVANVIACFVSVLFAFITNKLFVFKSKGKLWFKECMTFFGARGITGVLDTACMYLFVSVLNNPKTFAKIVVSIIVVLANYILSKYVVFSKKNEKIS